MWTELIAKVKETLAKITEIKAYSNYPDSNITKYPYVYFSPSAFSNSLETTNENMAIYRFDLFVVVGASGSTIGEVTSVVLPKVVDAIIKQFDEDWDLGSVGGHRARIKVDVAGTWSVVEGTKGLEAFAPLTLDIKLLTSN